jgi:hypothetical protein
MHKPGVPRCMAAIPVGLTDGRDELEMEGWRDG